MICKYILLITFLNKPELIFCTQLNSFKQVLLFSTNDSSQHYSFAHSQMVSSIAIITNSSSIDQTFLYIQLNDQTVLFLTIQFSISHFLHAV